MDEARTDRTDLQLILGIQALRAFLYGFGSVILGSALASGGLSDFEVGVVFTAMLAGMAASSIAVGLAGDRIGRRRAYAGLLLVMGAAGAVFALTRSLPLLVLVALTGTLSTDPNESGPITSLEQAMMGGAPAAVRARVFGRYNAVAYLAGAIGALAAGGPDAFRRLVPALPADQRWLLAFPVLALVCAALARRLSGAVEAGTRVEGVGHRAGGLGEGVGRGAERRGGPASRSARPRPLDHSRRTVIRLAALFGMDSFAGGFIVQTFIVFWFGRKFGASPASMGLVFFVAGLLQAGSSIASGRLASRIGLLNTMVFTHLPSNVLLVLVPFMPTLGWAVAAMFARYALSQMDVPARQAYVVAMVDPRERTAAAAFTNTARYVTRPFGALGAGALMERVALGSPFVVAGALKIAYDVWLYATFRKVPLPKEGAAASLAAAPTPLPAPPA
ncbi:MAG TPA: MFS transporter [Actinomycetota bacterium]|nr:MFS transporter [Actinomycetota bacterium]